ncbi:prolyl oligopeptidase family serine peptidase [Marinobacter sp. S0848L]|uniref:S9 family peptidase n=1 Tax=Marinobacter sp. S0848L TaxID=2926423 RepID=UPI001FF5ECAA|nr:prolyl oligopeptidase family serine peptidase [Marinobacter sp. S0848L]
MSFSESNLISAREACAGARQYAELRVSGGMLFWLATEPEDGFVSLWRYDGRRSERLNTGNSIRSRLNGYGGGAYAVTPESVCWVSEDQCLWSMNLESRQRQLLVRDPDSTWGGLTPDPLRPRWIAVREKRGEQDLVAVDFLGRLTVLDDQFDFYGAPAICPDGQQIAWTGWFSPHMPWDQSWVCLAELESSGKPVKVAKAEPPGGGSVQQPQFVAQSLWVVSDHGDWWQPYRVVRQEGELHWLPALSSNTDHANAPWQLGEKHACPLPGGGWARVRYRQGIGELWLEQKGEIRQVASAYTDFRDLVVSGDDLYCVARRPDLSDTILRLNLFAGQQAQPLFSAPVALGGNSCVWPESIVLPSGGEHPRALQGFLYLPEQPVEKPPLILIAHGGPTSAAYATFNPQAQFWCQRGFAVAEVNYTGSTGFGREFRQALAGQWGEADVADMFRMKDALSDAGLVDPNRVFVQGRSSGGYTALMSAIQPEQRLSGLASLYGVTDPLTLKAATHRFESGYLDWLLGEPGPKGHRWQARTPARLARQIVCPALFFQGGRDRVVVPEQTLSMVKALKETGQYAELVWFDEEEHGFRTLESQAKVLDTLWQFYSGLARRKR